MKSSILKLSFIMIVVFALITAGCSNSGSSGNTDNTGGEGQTYKMVIGAAINEQDWRSQGLKDFKKIVEERTKGQIQVEVFFGGTLGNDSELIQKTQMNNIQGVITSTSNLSKTIEKLKVLDLPFAAPQPAQYQAFYNDGQFGGELTAALQEQAKEKALHLLYLYPFQPRQVATKDKFIKTVDDMKGLNIRTSSSEIERGIISAFNANPITLGIGEVYTALQTGTVDGEGLPFTDMHSFKHSEVAKKVSFVNFQSMAVIVATSKEFYDSLPSELQQIVSEAASEVGKQGIEYMDEAYAEVRQEMENEGVEFYENSNEELETFREAAQQVIDSYSNEIGQEWIDQAYEALGQYLK